MMTRTDLLNLIEAAFTAHQPTYARQAAQRFLSDWPGDLGVQFALARAYAAEGQTALAANVLEALVAADPEDFRAHRLLGAQLLALGKTDFAAHAFASAHVGDGLREPKDAALPGWAISTRAAYVAEKIGDWETAQREAQSALQADTPSPLPSLTYLAALWHAGQLELALPLAEGFHARWPRVVAFQLCLAECLYAQGPQFNLRATELLHTAAALDSAGQVAVRHWGAAHPYRAMWESNFRATLPGPLPAEVVTLLGVNRISGQQKDSSSKIQDSNSKSQSPNPNQPSAISHQPSEEVADIQSQLDALAQKLASKETLKYRLRKIISHGRLDNGHYVLLSSRTRLTQAFGAEGFAQVDGALKNLALAAGQHTGLISTVLYVDEPETLAPFGLRPVNPSNAWDIKHLLGQLAEHLRQREQTIGALVIIGGAEIVPFHHLPNPTDDSDPDIPSDNPYATPDENYFVPEWPVGRLPSGVGQNPAPLVHAIDLATQAHRQAMKDEAPRNWLLRLWQSVWGGLAQHARRASLGYVADVWRQASAAVFTAIGDPKELLTCPPADASWFPIKHMAPAHLSYFNLHGIEDGPDWYGQRRYDAAPDGPEYPVALRPADVLNSGRAPSLVFSEACYGTNILGKRPGEALCLRFLECGSQAIVGSTKIAYGSVGTPLIGADLLGRLFWQNAAGGQPVGEALRRAKLQMAQTMHERQGFLDGEDQKTLISFVLYGDPLTSLPRNLAPKKAKLTAPQSAGPRSKHLPPTAEDKAEGKVEISPDTVAQIKTIVAQYLPGMQDADLRGAYAQARCYNPHASTKNIATAKSAPRNTVVTLTKTITTQARAHAHFARVTVDEKGKVVKLAVSR